MTLDPGVYDHTEAPWWRFTSPDVDDTTVVKQWMKEAAEVFAQEMSKRSAGGDTRVEVAYLMADGMSGVFQVFFQHHRHPTTLTVVRGEQTMEPKDGELQIEC